MIDQKNKSVTTVFNYDLKQINWGIRAYTAKGNIAFMAPMNRDALGASLFIGIGMRRRIGIHRNRDAPAHCIHMNRMRRRIVIHRNKDAPPMNRDTPAYPYS